MEADDVLLNMILYTYRYIMKPSMNIEIYAPSYRIFNTGRVLREPRITSRSLTISSLCSEKQTLTALLSRFFFSSNIFQMLQWLQHLFILKVLGHFRHLGPKIGIHKQKGRFLNWFHQANNPVDIGVLLLLSQWLSIVVQQGFQGFYSKLFKILKAKGGVCPILNVKVFKKDSLVSICLVTNAALIAVETRLLH